jgi:hypothetical protein
MKLKIFMLVLSTVLLISLFDFLYNDIKGDNRAVRYFNDGDFQAASENFDREFERLLGNCTMLNNMGGLCSERNAEDKSKIGVMCKDINYNNLNPREICFCEFR